MRGRVRIIRVFRFSFAICQDYYEDVIHFPFYLPTIGNGCFASNAKIPERGKFPRLNRTYISLRDRNTSDGALKGKATISRCFTTVIKRDFASETATNACLHSIPKLHLPAHPMTQCHFDLSS